MNKKRSQELTRSVTLGVLTRFVVACILFTLASVLLLFFGMFVCYLIPWNGGPLYNFLITIRNNVIFFMIVYLIFGYIVIFLIFWAKTLGYLADLVRATELIYKGGDRPIELPSALHDIENRMNTIKSDMLASKRAAEDAERRKNELVVYLAHDLKTPLTSVIGYLTLLRDVPELDTAQRAKFTGIALDKAERLEDLINEFFDITRFSLTGAALDRRDVDLSRMLEQLADEFAPMLRERGLEIKLDAPRELPINCDPDKLERVFDNLLRNAMNYAWADTVIDISLRKEGREAVVVFENRGDTIDDSKLERLFEQFFRLDSARQSRSGGSGLGLAIAKEIVEQHGGSIRAESADERVRFTVRLPLSSENRKKSAGK